MSAAPAMPGGAVAVICVAETTIKPVAVVSPKSTAVAPAKPVPLIVTTVPPDTGPLDGEAPDTTGGAVWPPARAGNNAIASAAKPIPMRVEIRLAEEKKRRGRIDIWQRFL